MKKIKKSSEFLWILGMLSMALGVALCSKTDLGVSMIAAPAFIIAEAIKLYIPSAVFFEVGVIEYIFQGILLIILCLIIRKFNWRFLLAFAVAVVYGYTLNLFLLVLGGVDPESLALRWILLILGDCFTAFGVACFFRTYLPLQVYELFVSEISRRFNFKIGKTKWGFDLCLLAVSGLLVVSIFFDDFKTLGTHTLACGSFHSIGVGTLVTTLINSPIIVTMGKLLDKIFEPTPMFEGSAKFFMS